MHSAKECDNVKKIPQVSKVSKTEIYMAPVKTGDWSDLIYSPCALCMFYIIVSVEIDVVNQP